MKLSKKDEDSEEDEDADEKIYAKVRCSAEFSKEDIWKICLISACNFILKEKDGLTISHFVEMQSALKWVNPGKFIPAETVQTIEKEEGDERKAS